MQGATAGASAAKQAAAAMKAHRLALIVAAALIPSEMTTKITIFVAAIALAFVLSAAAMPAKAIEHRNALPEAMTGSWCHENDSTDNRDVFTLFDGPGEHTLSTGEVVEVCPYHMLWLETECYSQSGELCDFEKIEETTPNVYLIHAHCRGQSGVEGSWNAIMEFEIIDGHLVITYIYRKVDIATAMIAFAPRCRRGRTQSSPTTSPNAASAASSAAPASRATTGSRGR